MRRPCVSLNFGDYEEQALEPLSPEEIEQVRAFEDFLRCLEASRSQTSRSASSGLWRRSRRTSTSIFTAGGVIRLLLRGMGVTRFVGNCALVRVDWDAQTLLEEREGPG